MTIFRFSLLAIAIAAFSLGMLAYFTERAAQKELSFAQLAAKKCGLPQEFIRLDENADRGESIIKMGGSWYGCQPVERKALECFDNSMKEGERSYTNTNLMGSCISPPPAPEFIE
jgi:hypothetical protein